MSHISASVSLKLFLWGPARLEHGNREVKLRRKGLATLYYLALEGTARREVLSDLLWGHSSASRNLRVELHLLRQALAKLGYIAFPSGQESLKLPESIQLDTTAGSGDLLEGLDDLSPDFQLWLEGQRGRWSAERPAAVERNAHIEEIASQIRAPFLLFLKGQPGAGCGEFARSLAKALGLPFFEGTQGHGRALHYLPPPYPADAADTILGDRDCVWVIECPAYGEDPRLVLELRSRWPSGHARYLSLPPLSWHEARSSLLRELPLAEAAEMYLLTAGNPLYLQELTALKAKRNDGMLPLPQRARAAIQLESRYLSMEARMALERLSVHPGPLDEGLLSAFEVKPYLDEIERHGHLVYDRRWRFADEAVRHIIYTSLQPGRRERYHRVAAAQLGREAKHVAEAYHLHAAGEALDWSALREKLPEWARYSLETSLASEEETAAPAQKALGLKSELALLEMDRFGPGLEVYGDGISWVRTPTQNCASGVEWQLPEEACVLHLKGHAFLKNPLTVGLSGEAIPLMMDFFGEGRKAVVLAPAPAPRLLEDGSLLLPLGEHFEYWLYVDGYWGVRIKSLAEAGIFELEYAVYRPASSAAGDGSATLAYDVRATPVPNL